MKNILKVNLFFLVLVLLQIFGGYLLRPVIGLLHFKIWSTLILTQILFLIVPIVIYIIITKQSFVKVLKFKTLSIKNIGYIVVISFLTVPVMSFLGSITNLFFHNNVSDVLAQMKSLPLWAMVLVVALLPAFCEELTMRGVILSGFKDMSMGTAALVSGFLFALLHLNPPQFLYAFALGIILAYLVNITKSIFASMICHFTFNGINSVASWAALNSNAKVQDITAIPLSVRIITLGVLFVISIFCTIIIYYLLKSMKEYNKAATKPIIETEENELFINNGNMDKLTGFSPVLVSIAFYIIFVFKMHISLIPVLILLLCYFIFIIYRMKIRN